MKLFEAATAVSESRPWFLSLVRRFRDFRARRDQSAGPTVITAAPVAVQEIWSKHKTGAPRLMSVSLHAALIATALIPWAAAPKNLLMKGAVDIALYPPKAAIVLPVKDNGGGGGGRHQLTPPSLGKLPRAADKQLVPPDPEPPKNLAPILIEEPSLVALELPASPQLNLLSIGDPDGIPGPPSSGDGKGNGIGGGNGNGIGDHDGPGFKGDKGGGVSSDPGGSQGRGSISNPILLSQVLPEYSEEARKARFEGRVELDTIVREDGSVQIVRVAHPLGYGLDEKAIEAVLQWRFRPGRMNGKPVPVPVRVEVSFNLR